MNKSYVVHSKTSKWDIFVGVFAALTVFDVIGRLLS